MRYLLRSPNGKYVSLDSVSGGYPYEVDDPFQAKMWVHHSDAVRYCQMFGEKKYQILSVFLDMTLVTD